MDLSCKLCNSEELTIENCERICTNCGDVQEEIGDEGNLCMVPDGDTALNNQRNKEYEAKERLTGRIRYETNSNESRRRINREQLVNEARRIVKQLVKHSSAVDETIDLIISTFEAYKGRLLNSKKLGLVGACIYYLSAKHQLGISLSNICKIVGIKMKVISICMKQVRQLCPNFEYERPNIKDLVKKFIDEISNKHYDLGALDSSANNVKSKLAKDEPTSDLQPLIDNKDRMVLENRVMLLIDLFEAMHPYNGPTPQCLVTAVIYHAWRSLDTFKLIATNLQSGVQSISNPETSKEIIPESDRHQINQKAIRMKHSISFEKFCQICNLKYSSNGYKIVSKLQSSMLMLGRHLGDVNKVNLPWFLKDIIENSPILIQEHMRTESNSKSRQVS